MISHIAEIVPGLALLIILVSFRCIIVLRQIRSASNVNVLLRRKRSKPVKTIAVLGSGGHTTEMIILLSSITSHDNYQPLNYIIASTDTTSIQRLQEFRKPADENNYKDDQKTNKHIALPPYNNIFYIPRAREVGQSYFTSIFTTIYSIIHTAHIVLIKTQPDLVLLNGPGTCLPIAFWTFIGRLLGLCEGKIIFCESFCRVKSLSLTGNILWKTNIVDLFMVHWPELLEKKAGNDRMILINSFIEN